MIYKVCSLIFFFSIAFCENYSVLSLSSAIVDHCLLISDEDLNDITSEKGGWAPVDYRTFCALLDENPDSIMIPGGSGVNVIKGLAHLGEKCAVIGKIGNDKKGEYYQNYMKGLGITSLLKVENLPTGQTICFITPDKQRTFRTYIGASHCLNNLKLDPSLFKDIQLFHIEGYQLIDHDLVIRALIQAKKNNVKVSMDLANIEIVRRNKDFIWDLIETIVDILFCNEMEAEELTGMNASDACAYLSKFCEIAVVTMSEKGSWAQRGEEKIHTPAQTVETMDTTGAGDYFTGGFLQAYLRHATLKKCAWQGALLASYVVQVIGADIPEDDWEEILQEVQKG